MINKIGMNAPAFGKLVKIEDDFYLETSSDSPIRSVRLEESEEDDSYVGKKMPIIYFKPSGGEREPDYLILENTAFEEAVRKLDTWR